MIDWRSALTEDDQRRIRNVVDAATDADGVAPVGDGVLRELSSDRTRHLVATDDENLVGYLNLVPGSADAPAMAEVVVHPSARRRGTGAELIRAGLAEGGDGARIWAHGNLEPARAVAGALELTSVRELWQMRRPLAGLPDVAVAPGIRLRTYAGPEDDAELLRVNNAAFSWHPEQGGWTDADVAERRAESWFDPEGLFLAFDEETGNMLGFHWTKVHSEHTGGQSAQARLQRSDPGNGTGGQSTQARLQRSDPGNGTGGQSTQTRLQRSDPGSQLGEVYVVGVDPDAQGRGLGATLTLVGLHHLADRLGTTSTVMLYVEADNSQAVRTYERLRFEVAGADVAYTAR